MIALAAIAEHRDEIERAAGLLGAADGLLEQMGASLKPYERDLHQHTTEALRARLGPRFDEITARARSLPLAEVLARGDATTKSPPKSSP